MKKMKKLTFFILILLIARVCLGQQSNENPFNINLPDKLYEISKSQYTSQLTSNWKNPKLPQDKTQIQNDHIFKLNNIYLTFIESGNDPMLEKDLNVSKNEMIDLLKTDKSITVNYSKMISFNNINYWVLEYHDGDEVWLRFRSEYHKDQNIIGCIEFKQSDESAAQNELTKFLNGISLKN